MRIRTYQKRSDPIRFRTEPNETQCHRAATNKNVNKRKSKTKTNEWENVKMLTVNVFASLFFSLVWKPNKMNHQNRAVDCVRECIEMLSNEINSFQIYLSPDQNTRWTPKPPANCMFTDQLYMFVTVITFIVHFHFMIYLCVLGLGLGLINISFHFTRWLYFLFSSFRWPKNVWN